MQVKLIPISLIIDFDLLFNFKPNFVKLNKSDYTSKYEQHLLFSLYTSTYTNCIMV